MSKNWKNRQRMSPAERKEARAERQREYVWSRSPVWNLLADPGYAQGVAERLWRTELEHGGAVSRYIDSNPQLAQVVDEWVGPAPVRYQGFASFDPRYGTLARVLSAQNGPALAAELFFRHTGDLHQQLREQGMNEGEIAEWFGANAPVLGDAKGWAAHFQSMEPIVKQHNQLIAESDPESGFAPEVIGPEVVEELHAGDKREPVETPAARITRELEAETDPLKREELEAELKHERNRAAKQELDRKANPARIEEAARAAYETHERAELEAELENPSDPRTPGRHLLARAIARGVVTEPRDIMDAHVSMEKHYALESPPSRQFMHEDRVSQRVRAAYAAAEAAQYAAAGHVPPPLDERERAAHLRNAVAEHAAMPGSPPREERRPSLRGRVEEAYAFETAVSRAGDELRAEGKLPASTAPAPEPRGPSAHEGHDAVRSAVEAAYDKHSSTDE